MDDADLEQIRAKRMAELQGGGGFPQVCSINLLSDQICSHPEVDLSFLLPGVLMRLPTSILSRLTL